MIGTPFELQQEDNNPLDFVQDLIVSKGWKYSRADDEFMIVHMPGQKGMLEVCMEWQEEFSALLFACSLPIEIAEANYEMAARTMEKINQNIWLGHFDLSNKNIYPTYRHTLLLRMIPAGIAVDIISDIMAVALAECDRFYTTFQLIQAGDVRLQDNLSAVIFETIGEA